ncbi:MAG: orotate phosphoribosyltransferase [Cyanobacteria bacterium SZAS LIN-3]|nr:orotate phosphoribosyltransferase [Cyanobacteria bacterium SZAS LIN-3]
MATVEELLKSVSAWQSGHFLLSSGLHSSEYMQCQRVLQYPEYGQKLAAELAEKIVAAGIKPQVVVGPALGAVHLEVFVAIALNNLLAAENGSQVRAVFAERAEDGINFAIRRGVELAPGERVLVVEDVTTTGGSAKRVVELVKSMGAAPVAVAAIIDRSGGKAQFDLPFIKLITLDIQTFESSVCPMCQAGGTAIKPGSSKK